MLGCDAAAGSVSYDQCVLDGSPAAAVVTGKVTNEHNSPLEGALVTTAKQSVRTGRDGAFTPAKNRDPLTRVPVLSS